MARGIVPRQPSKSGRQEGRRAPGPLQKSSRLPRFKPPVKAEAKAKRPVKPTNAKSPKSSAGSPAQGSPTRPDVGRGGVAVRAARAGVPYDPLAPQRVQEILQRLDATYPNATCALHHNNAWELLVATILSAQCTDVRVNMTTPELFRKYPTVQAVAALKPEQLEPDIRSTGFFRNKAKSVVGAAKMIVGDFGGEVPSEMEQLLTLPGVARKTANVLLGTWFHKNEGVVVDTHVHRISRRLELTTNTDPNKIEQDLVRILPRERWTSFSHQVIWHGRRLCTARSPKCVDCPLESICHAADKTWSTVDIHKNSKP